MHYVIIMNFGNIGSIGGAVTDYMATPEGKEAVMKFLASPQGMALLQNFAGTPDGKKTMAGLLPQVLGGMNLPPGAAEMVLGALGAQK